MNSNPPPFEEPSLRQALRDIADQRPASATLRARVGARMSAEPVEASPMKIARQRPVGFKRLLTAAAALFVAGSVAVVAYELYDEFGPRQDALAMAATTPTLWQSMAELHDCGVSGSRAAVALSATEPDAVAAEAAAKLQRHVPTPHFAGADWKLDGSSFADVGGFAGVQFHLTDGKRSVTIVSLPEAAWAYRSSDAYTITVNDHAIAGYVKGGGLHCVIGDKNMPLAEVESLTNQLRAQ